MDSTGKEMTHCYAIINNIPFEYHSADLRNYFSQFIEENGFECFHFRHRPEQIQSENNQNIEVTDNTETQKKRSTCCVVKLKVKQLHKLTKMYQRRHWVDKKGDIMRQICYISKIRDPVNADNPQFATRAEEKQIPSDRELFTLTDLHKLPELHPPDIMPNGNVGTPTMYFMDLIKQCRLPPSVIKKLGLTFPKTKTNKRYGNVPYDYGNCDTVVSPENIDDEIIDICTASGHKIPEFVVNDNIDTCSIGSTKSGSSNNSGSKEKRKRNSYIDKEMRKRMDLRIEEKLIGEHSESEEDNDSCEEWERHEAMYDDPSNQERNKERLFEEEIELKWEKGGSGLVFYTDAQYWHAQEGDFDEQTADDWDVDMSCYYKEGAGDKDARDYLTIRQEKRRRDGIEATDRFTAGIAKRRRTKTYKRGESARKIGDFEDHTRGIGRKILEQQGWSEGKGLGSSVQGMADALDNEGQNPRDRTGFGYRGEKLNRYRKPAQRKVIISTIYDDHKQTDPHEPPLRRHEPYTLKYRDEIKFSKAKAS